MRRREFVGSLAGAWAVGRLELGRPYAGRLGNLGIQLYTVRRDLARDAEGTLARVAEIGFREVEFAGFPQGSAASLRAMLDRHGLTAPSGHVALQALRSDWDRTLDAAAAVGQRYIVVAFLPAEERRTADDWKRLAALFNHGAEAARQRKIQFAYHNHDFEFDPFEGQTGYDLLLAETDRKLVQFEMDLYWISKAGRDPAEYFARWPGRFPLLHVKDMDATPAKSFTEVGRGVIDFRRIFKRARQAGVRHFFYEQDSTPGSPFDSARVSYDFLRALKF